MSTTVPPRGASPHIRSSPPPPPYRDVGGAGRGHGGPDPGAGGAGLVAADNKRGTSSIARWVAGLFRTASCRLPGRGPPPPRVDGAGAGALLETQDLEITVHDTSPNITEVVAVRCDERRRRVTVDVKVSASVTARSKGNHHRHNHNHNHNQPAAAVVVPVQWWVRRTAQATFRRSRGRGGAGTFRSVAVATEKATRDAAEEAHRRAVTLATMKAAAKALGDVAAQARAV